ncbi:MAG: MarR family transcriptional regulator [Lentisphaeria bacterium]|nr:MarR family transcriptional regulator [Lentisphaeria bacterium]
MDAIKLYNEFPEKETHEHQALMGVWNVGQLLKIQARRFFRQYLSSEMQFNIMLLLKNADHPMNQQELSEKLFVDKSNLTGVAGRMEASGLLTRRVDPCDSRAYLLELTPRGRRILERVELPYRTEVKKVMADFSPAELSMLIRFMERMRKTLNSEE